MPVTVKVNGPALSLVHKGSSGISNATIPDVCKTPAPPGPPVPIPYPNVSMSSDLMQGTTTVKADGGNMIAIDGSQFMKSTGDEAGVAGGVVSSTFIKESTWILYSFDVKMDGKGACRLSDKKFHNHQNTVNAQGEVQAPVVPAPANPLKIDCENYNGPNTGPLTDCEKKQVCAKCDEVNRQAQSGVLKRNTKEEQKIARKAGNTAAGAFREVFTIVVQDKMYTEDMMRDHFAHDCAYEEWKAAGSDPTFRNPFYSPDHVHEIQLGGSPSDAANLKWTSKNANEYIGRSLKDYNPETHDGVEANCCD
jgi:hypothetical protein